MNTNKSMNLVIKTAQKIQIDLKKFLEDVVIPASNGYVRNEGDAALLLYDILAQKYDITT